MSQVRVHNFSVSLDGFGTGIGQSVDAPYGHAGPRLHEWFFATRTFRSSPTAAAEAKSGPFLIPLVMGVSTNPGLMVRTATPDFASLFRRPPRKMARAPFAVP